MIAADSWAFDPATVTAVATAVTGIFLIAAAFFALRQVVETRRAREAGVLLGLIDQFDRTFLSEESYRHLLTRSLDLKHAGKAHDWAAPLDEHEVALLKVLKLYAIAGSLYAENMIRVKPLLTFIAAPLEHHYRDFHPYIESSASFVAIERLHELCLKLAPPESLNTKR